MLAVWGEAVHWDPTSPAEEGSPFRYNSDSSPFQSTEIPVPTTCEMEILDSTLFSSNFDIYT